MSSNSSRNSVSFPYTRDHHPQPLYTLVHFFSYIRSLNFLSTCTHTFLHKQIYKCTVWCATSFCLLRLQGKCSVEQIYPALVNCTLTIILISSWIFPGFCEQWEGRTHTLRRYRFIRARQWWTCEQIHCFYPALESGSSAVLCHEGQIRNS